MLFFEMLNNSILNLKVNKFRSFLTMLGIIIGISSVIGIASLGEGGQNLVTGKLKEGGYGKFNVSVDKNNAKFRNKYFFTPNLINSLNETNKFKNISPDIGENILININKEKEFGYLEASTIEFEKISPIQLVAGRNFIPLEYESGENIIVIDNITATQLYGSPSQSLNRIIRISKDWDKSLISYRVIGVMKNPIENLIKLMGEEDFPRFVRVPLKTYEKNFSTLSNKYTTLIVESKFPKNLAQDMKDIKVILNSLTNTKNLYEVNVKNTGAESFEQILKFLNLFISIVASISIIVGGIGIMNIMLVNIIERTNEIGIRKAIGATNLDILILFLLESITLSFIGSFIGIFLGICLSLIIGYFIGVQPIFNYFFILFLMLVSIFIGVVFGVFPAIKASKLDPVEALRK